MGRAASVMALLIVMVAAGCGSALQFGGTTSTPTLEFAFTREGVLTVNVFVESPCLTPSPLGDGVESNLDSFRHLQFSIRVLQIGDEFEASESPSFSLTHLGQGPTTIYVNGSLAYDFARSREDFGFESTITAAPVVLLTVRDATRMVSLHKRQLLPAEEAIIDVHALVPGGIAATALAQLSDDPARLEVWKTDQRSAFNELMGKSLQTSVILRAECDAPA